MAKKKEKVNIPQNKEPYTQGCDFCMQFDYDDIHVIGASPDEHGGIELVIKAYNIVGDDPSLMIQFISENMLS